jgi:hypothetical protein
MNYLIRVLGFLSLIAFSISALGSNSGFAPIAETTPLTKLEEPQAYVTESVIKMTLVSKTRAKKIQITLDPKTLKPRANVFYYTVGWDGLSSFTRFQHANRLEMYTYDALNGVQLKDLADYLSKNNSKLSGSISSRTSNFIGVLVDNSTATSTTDAVTFCASFQIEKIFFYPDYKALPKRNGNFQKAPFASASIKILERLADDNCKASQN